MKTLIGYFLALFALMYPMSARASDSFIVLTEDLQLKVADAFMAEGEYYRAVTEYKKFLILFPESGKADYVLFRTGMAYYSGEEYESSARSFASLREKFFGSSYVADAGYFEGLSYWRLKKYEFAKSSFRSIVISYPESDRAPQAIIACSLVCLDKEDLSGCTKELNKLIESYPDHPGATKARDAMKLISEYQNLPRKSEVLAGTMSAVLPGSGYMYAGHFKDGLTSFFINGLSIAGAATGIQQENYAVGAIAGGIGLPFYFGNIYGSANAAKKWNSAARDELRYRIHSVLGFQF